MPGLLQTREYAEALIRAAHLDATDEQITQFVELRMARQQRLTGDDPVRFAAVVDEGALRRPVGGFTVFRMRPPYPLAGFVTTPAGNLVVEAEKAEKLLQTYDRLRDVALREKAAVAFLTELEARLE